MAEHTRNQFERDAVRLFPGRRYWTNSWESLDLESGTVAAHVGGSQQR